MTFVPCAGEHAGERLEVATWSGFAQRWGREGWGKWRPQSEGLTHGPDGVLFGTSAWLITARRA